MVLLRSAPLPSSMPTCLCTMLMYSLLFMHALWHRNEFGFVDRCVSILYKFGCHQREFQIFLFFTDSLPFLRQVPPMPRVHVCSRWIRGGLQTDQSPEETHRSWGQLLFDFVITRCCFVCSHTLLFASTLISCFMFVSAYDISRVKLLAR